MAYSLKYVDLYNIKKEKFIQARLKDVENHQFMDFVKSISGEIIDVIVDYERMERHKSKKKKTGRPKKYNKAKKYL